MKKPKAILFDLDDTILAFSTASERAWEKCCDIFIQNNAVAFTSRELYESILKTRKCYWSDPERNKKGRENMKNARREVFGCALEKFGFNEREAIYATADSYTKLQETLWTLFDGTADALETLKKLNIRMAVVTNGATEIQRGKLERFNILPYFEHIITDAETGVSKPDVRIYKIALDKLSLDPASVWMIGDHLVWDVEGPQKAGIFSVWNDFKREGLPGNNLIQPNMIVSSISEMVSNIETI